MDGDINTKEGYIESFEFLRSWEKEPLGKTLSNTFNTQVKMENDAVIAAIGEALYGHGKNVSEFLYFTWGSGFGGCVVKKARKHN